MDAGNLTDLHYIVAGQGKPLPMAPELAHSIAAGRKNAAITTCNLFYSLGRQDELGKLLRFNAGEYDDLDYQKFFHGQALGNKLLTPPARKRRWLSL